jgi:SAM-dependent methyltransferase
MKLVALLFVAERDQAGGGWSEAVASAWEHRRDRQLERHRRTSQWLVDQIAPRPGQTILELAAGPGETGFLAAERVGPGGKLISTDITPAMTEAARRGAAARGLGNVEFRVMDAQRIDLLDDSVDGVLCRFGFMLMPEPHRALSEASRVLRVGGRLAYAVFGRPGQNPWITALARAIDEAGQRLTDDPFGPDGPFFSLAAPDRNRDLLDAAGFCGVRVEEISEARRYDSFDDYWDHHSHATPPVAALVSSLSAEDIESIRAALRPKLEQFQTGTGYEIPSLVVAVSAAAAHAARS